METTTTQTINKRQIIVWSLRILLAGLFLLSGVAKLYPSPEFAVTTFEQKQLIQNMGFNETFALFFSRILIGSEFALGFLLLQPHFFKRLILPVSFLLLLVFNIHLTYTIFSTGNSGSCGCFGDLLPMTPLEAIIKNVIAMVMMGFVYKMTDEDKSKSNFLIPLSVTVLSIVTLFILAPMNSAAQENTVSKVVVVEEEDPVTPEKTVTTPGSSTGEKDPKSTDAEGKEAPKGKEGDQPEEVKKDDAPAAKKSGYASIFPDIDSDKKLLCFFAPGCEHCQQAAKELTEMKKTIPGFPSIRIAFMDEEPERIPEFFEFAGSKYTYTVLDIAKFWQTIGNRDTPGVFYIWNGNVVKVYDGIDANAFKAKELKALVQKPWSEVK